MKILHLFSDWKWTGPAEPVVALCKALTDRGHYVVLAYQRPPDPEREGLASRVAEKGIRWTDRFYLDHSLKPGHPSSVVRSLRDLWRLKRFLREERFDIVCVHLSHDHVLGGLAARGSRVETVVIRTDHQRDPLKPSLGNRMLLRWLTDGLITFSERARREDSDHFRFSAERVCKAPPALDLERFNPHRPFKDMRAHFGVAADEVLIGMVARFQRYRKTEVFLEAFQSIVREFPKTKLLLIGRSSQMEESVIKPIKRLGIAPWVVLGGYQTDHYVDTLASMDIFVFLMAGSDGTARALREAMAMGKPAIVADRGMLPELVEEGVSGFVVKDSPDDLARASLELLRNPELRWRMGRAAYERAQREFRLERQAEVVEAFYERMVRLGRRRSS